MLNSLIYKSCKIFPKLYNNYKQFPSDICTVNSNIQSNDTYLYNYWNVLQRLSHQSRKSLERNGWSGSDGYVGSANGDDYF